MRSKFGIEFEILEIVQKVERCSGEPYVLRKAKRLGPWFGVYIAADGIDGSDVLEVTDDGGVAYVAGVQDGLPARAARASGRSRPWVSEMKPARKEGIGEA